MVVTIQGTMRMVTIHPIRGQKRISNSRTIHIRMNRVREYSLRDLHSLKTNGHVVYHLRGDYDVPVRY